MNRPIEADRHPLADKRSFLLFTLLLLAGLAGNHFKFEIFFNIDFIFGSIFSLLILQFFGVASGVIAGALIAGYTYILWNHPYAIVIMTLEVAFVGIMMRKRNFGMVMANAIYWLFIGMPLVYIFYHLTMDLPLSNSCITMLKQAINGICNALLARLVFHALTSGSEKQLPRYYEVICNRAIFFILAPTLLLIAFWSRSDFRDTDKRIREDLREESARAAALLVNWESNRKNVVTALAEMASVISAREMQPYIELAARTDKNFKRIGLLDKKATITAYHPLADELGNSNIGKNFKDRPYIPILRRTLKPIALRSCDGEDRQARPDVGYARSGRNKRGVRRICHRHTRYGATP